MVKNAEKVILHCDMNNFYASVEQKLHPEYAGQPLAVCGNPKSRHGIILAKNMLAKTAGVKTGEAIWEAQSKCPGLILTPPRFDEYVKISDKVFEMYTTYTDRVESFGIDECWLDVTQSISLFGSGKEIADKIRERIKSEFGLTVSVGVSFTKTLAKLGSDLKKPDATTILSRENYLDVIGKLEPSELIMIGRATSKKLAQLNIHTIRELAEADRTMLRQHFGVVGDRIVDAARGEGGDEVKKYYDVRIPQSVSNGTTTTRDMTALSDAKTVIYALCELIAVRLRKYSLAAEGIYLSMRSPDLNDVSRQSPIGFPTSNASDLAKCALKLFSSMHSFPSPLRAITVGAIRLTAKDRVQIGFFDGDVERQGKLEVAVDDIRKKYGYHSVERGVVVSGDLIGHLHDEDGFEPFKR